jgi:hypothetical protein
MAEADVIAVTATRYDVARIQIVQFLAPAAMILGVVARWRMTTPLLLAGFALILFTFGLYASSRAALGRRALQIRNGILRLAIESTALGETAPCAHDPADDIALRSIRKWTWDGSIARLYAAEHSWKLRSARGDHETLGDSLRETLGPPLVLRRRGSARARVLALSMAALGVVAAGFGIAYETTALALIGVPCLIGGLAALGALSQSVAR